MLLVAIAIEFTGQSTDAAQEPATNLPAAGITLERVIFESYEFFVSDVVPRLFTFDTTLGVIFCIQTGLLALGLIVGFSKRKNRQLEYEAEVHNRKFFRQHGLQEIQDDRLRDSHNIGYHLENILGNELEFKVAGHRGKRAYLKFDSTGKYTSWSGVVVQR